LVDDVLKINPNYPLQCDVCRVSSFTAPPRRPIGNSSVDLDGF
jgi:hypothetical protein